MRALHNIERCVWLFYKFCVICSARGCILRDGATVYALYPEYRITANQTCSGHGVGRKALPD
eukprot:8010694-Pyramimonas_sp.AAC.1